MESRAAFKRLIAQLHSRGVNGARFPVVAASPQSPALQPMPHDETAEALMKLGLSAGGARISS
jgi:hypothetical protein